MPTTPVDQFDKPDLLMPIKIYYIPHLVIEQALGDGDENGELPLHHAIAANNSDIACILISLMNVAQLNHKSFVGDTPLHLAIQHSMVCVYL